MSFSIYKVIRRFIISLHSSSFTHYLSFWSSLFLLTSLLLSLLFFLLSSFLLSLLFYLLSSLLLSLLFSSISSLFLFILFFFIPFYTYFPFSSHQTFKRLSPTSIFIFSFSVFITVFFNNFFAFLYFFSSPIVIPSNSIPVCPIFSSALLISHFSYFLFLFVLAENRRQKKKKNRSLLSAILFCLFI